MISFNELLRIKDDVAVIVSPLKADGIHRDLAASGVKNVVPERILRLLDLAEQSPGSSPFGSCPPGHYYSPYPDLGYVERHASRIYDTRKEVRGIDLNMARQLGWLGEFEKLYATMPNWENAADRSAAPSSAYRFRHGNRSYESMDAVSLHCMLRCLRPRRLIEVGSGWSSATTLDTNEFFLGNSIELSFIEPYPEGLRQILKPTDSIDLRQCGLQEMPLSFFDGLRANDVLFIDSSHVSKAGSDVNHLFFEILPRLASGVHIHLHDIHWPFEYPLQWLREGRAWNEGYLLRAFLMGSRDYEVQYFTSMMVAFCRERVSRAWPLDMPAFGGSFWMKKL